MTTSFFTMSSDARRALAEGHIANSIRATEIIQFFVIFIKFVSAKFCISFLLLKYQTYFSNLYIIIDKAIEENLSTFAQSISTVCQ